MRMHFQTNALKSIGSLLSTLLLGLLYIAAVEGAQAGRILVVFQEKQMGILGTTGFEQPGAAETLLIGTLRDLGYDVVDSETVHRNIVQSKGLRLLEGNDKAAAALGLQYGAEYSIVGKAISKPAGGKLYGSNLQSIHATVTARLIRNADARVLGSASGSDKQAHIDELTGGSLAIEKAVGTITPKLISALETHAVSTSMNSTMGNKLMLNISGLVSYRHLDFVMGYLENEVQGSNSVDLLSFNNGIAELSMDFESSSGDLARQIANKRFRGFRLEPTVVTDGRVDLNTVIDR
jgi:hypothetical protein